MGVVAAHLVLNRSRGHSTLSRSLSFEKKKKRGENVPPLRRRPTPSIARRLLLHAAGATVTRVLQAKGSKGDAARTRRRGERGWKRAMGGLRRPKLSQCPPEVFLLLPPLACFFALLLPLAIREGISSPISRRRPSSTSEDRGGAGPLSPARRRVRQSAARTARSANSKGHGGGDSGRGKGEEKKRGAEERVREE